MKYITLDEIYDEWYMYAFAVITCEVRYAFLDFGEYCNIIQKYEDVLIY
jgi:hypothetical protein